MLNSELSVEVNQLGSVRFSPGYRQIQWKGTKLASQLKRIRRMKRSETDSEHLPLMNPQE
jgi:hypothetical protein